MIQKPFFFAIIAIAFGFVVQGCQPSCDVIPTESAAQVRILNAVSNASVILVYIDGKLFDSAYFDLRHHYAGSGNRTFGEQNSFIADGSILRAGSHHIVAIAPSSIPGVPADTIDKSDYLLYDHPQSLIYFGKVHDLLHSPKLIYLNDALRSSDPKASYVRFIHAVPDLGTQDNSGLDIYFASSPRATPDLRMGYGKISDNNGTDHGTGLSANDYLTLKNPQGLLITPENDTNSADALLSVPYQLPTAMLVFTIVVRGESKPVSNEPPVSTVLLEDAQESPHGFAKVIETFGIRLVNATKANSLSMLVKGGNDAQPRNNIPGTSALLNVPSDSVGDYAPLSDYHLSADYWFSTTANPSDSIYHFARTHVANERSSYIAIDTIPHDNGIRGISMLELKDTLSRPVNSGQGRVRFVATSADYTAHFTFAGKTYDLKQRDVAYADASVGQYSISITDGASGHTTVSFNLTNDLPVTVFLMPSDQTQTIPYRLSTR